MKLDSALGHVSAGVRKIAADLRFALSLAQRALEPQAFARSRVIPIEMNRRQGSARQAAADSLARRTPPTRST